MAEKALTSYTEATLSSTDKVFGINSSNAARMFTIGNLATKSDTDDIELSGDITFSGINPITLSGDGTVFEDLVVPLTTTKIGSNNKPDFDETNVGYLFPAADAAEKLYFIVQMPHSWLEGSTIFPHVHYKYQSAGTPSFVLTYKWFNVGEAGAAPSNTYTMDTLVSGTPDNGDHWINTHATNAGIDGTGKTISSILVCTLHRVANNTPAADVLVYQFDIHYERDSMGSAEEYVKVATT